MSFAEDMSYNNGPMLSKEIFDEFLAPFYRAVDWYAEAGADGMFPLKITGPM
jgi:hypothetical protein